MRSALLILAFSLSAQAQTETEFALTTKQYEKAPSIRPNHIFSIDLGPTLSFLYGGGSGFGGRYQYILNDHISVGVHGSKEWVDDRAKHSETITWDLYSYGLDLRYKFSSFSSGGFFTGLELSTYASRGEDEVRDIVGRFIRKMETEWNYESAIVPKFGYMFVNHKSEFSSYSELSLSYGPRSTVDYTETDLGELTIQGRDRSLNFHGSIGATF